MLFEPEAAAGMGAPCDAVEPFSILDGFYNDEFNLFCFSSDRRQVVTEADNLDIQLRPLEKSE